MYSAKCHEDEFVRIRHLKTCFPVDKKDLLPQCTAFDCTDVLLSESKLSECLIIYPDVWLFIPFGFYNAFWERRYKCGKNVCKHVLVPRQWFGEKCYESHWSGLVEVGDEFEHAIESLLYFSPFLNVWRTTLFLDKMELYRWTYWYLFVNHYFSNRLFHAICYIQFLPKFEF